MRTDTREKIISYIGKHQPVRAHDLIGEFNFSAVAIHRQLKKLIESGVLQKIGQPPLVYYQLGSYKGFEVIREI